MPSYAVTLILAFIAVVLGITAIVFAAWTRACFSRAPKAWRPSPTSPEERDFIGRRVAESVFDDVVSSRARGKLSEVVALHFAADYNEMMIPDEANDVRVRATQQLLRLFREEVERDPTGRIARALPGLGIKVDSL